MYWGIVKCFIMTFRGENVPEGLLLLIKEKSSCILGQRDSEKYKSTTWSENVSLSVIY